MMKGECRGVFEFPNLEPYTVDTLDWADWADVVSISQVTAGGGGGGGGESLPICQVMYMCSLTAPDFQILIFTAPIFFFW